MCRGEGKPPRLAGFRHTGDTQLSTMRPSALLAALLALLPSLSIGLSCLSDSGAAVDWWLVLKAPDSTEAAYADSTGTNWGLSWNADLSSAGNALERCVWHQLEGGRRAWGLRCGPAGTVCSSFESVPRGIRRTVAQRSGTGVASVLYNDEPPTDALQFAAMARASSLRRRLLSDSSHGHTKGVVLANEGGGLWLVHSTPRYPLAGSDKFPSNEQIYAQSFLCVSLPADGIDAVGGALLLNRPAVYASSLPGKLAPAYPNLQAVLDGSWVADAKATTLRLQSVQGQSFTAFAKNAQWGQVRVGSSAVVVRGAIDVADPPPPVPAPLRRPGRAALRR